MPSSPPAISVRLVVTGAPGAAASTARPVATAGGRGKAHSRTPTIPGTSTMTDRSERTSRPGCRARYVICRNEWLTPMASMRLKIVTVTK